MVNLRKNPPKKKKKNDPAPVSQNEKENESVIVEVSPSPTKKRLLESKIEYNAKDMFVQSVRSYFLAYPGSCISTVDELKNVRTIQLVLHPLHKF